MGPSPCALIRLALKLDPRNYGALVLQALGQRDAEKPRDAVATIRRVADAWPSYAEPRLVSGDIYVAAGSRKSAVDEFHNGVRAPIKPYGAVNACNAELYTRIAEIYAAQFRAALKARSAATLKWSRLFNDAIINALKHNPSHPKARKLLVEMGGKIR